MPNTTVVMWRMSLCVALCSISSLEGAVQDAAVIYRKSSDTGTEGYVSILPFYFTT